MPRAAPVLPWFFFFENRDLHSKIESSFICSMQLKSSFHLDSSIGKPEIRKPIHPAFPLHLNCTEVQGKFPTKPAWTLHVSQGLLLLKWLS